MSHWQTGKLDLKCSLNILRKALINLMPKWEEHIQIDENGTLGTKYDGSIDSKQKYQLVVPANSENGLYTDVGLRMNENGTWDIGGGYDIGTLEQKLVGEVMRMRAIAIAQMRGYDIIRNENNEDEIVTDIRVDMDKAKELLT